MFGLLSLLPEFPENDLDDADTVVETVVDLRPIILVGDIVEVATRYGKPVLATCKDYDTIAQLRVLGQCQGVRLLYAMLVTGGDMKHVVPTARVDKRMSKDYNIESRFLGDDSVVVTDEHVRMIVKEQRGRHCEKCDEYNEDVRSDCSVVYYCGTCRDNPWR